MSRHGAVNRAYHVTASASSGSDPSSACRKTENDRGAATVVAALSAEVRAVTEVRQKRHSAYTDGEERIQCNEI